MIIFLSQRCLTEVNLSAPLLELNQWSTTELEDTLGSQDNKLALGELSRYADRTEIPETVYCGYILKWLTKREVFSTVLVIGLTIPWDTIE